MFHYLQIRDEIPVHENYIFFLPELESTAVKRAHCSANISHAKSGIEKIKEPDKNALMNVSFRVLRAFALSQGCNKW